MVENIVTRLSIAGEIAALAPTERKRYDALYAEAGYEFGFGRGGEYVGHSHLRFVDVLFAPHGIRRAVDDHMLGTLVVVPSRMYLPNVRTGDFAFLKFCADADPVVVPDKVEARLDGDTILSFVDEGRVELPWFRHEGARQEAVHLTLGGRELTVIVGQRQLLLTP
jgi:hypothetical protein